jgi:hypothetical protein
VADAVEAMRKLLGDNNVLAYLVMMTPRLVELHRTLKPTGSLYLHCLRGSRPCPWSAAG